MFYRMFKLLSIACVTAFVACAPPPQRHGHSDSSPGTAGDPGGGGIGKSTKEQVMSAIHEAIEMFEYGTFTNQDHIFKSIRTLADNYSVATGDLSYITIELGEETAELHRKNLKRSKISYDMKACPGVQAHKNAAVSDHKIGANLCFDVESLMQFPPSQLNREVFALLVHEYMHLRGHRENVAEQMQKIIIDSWPKLEFFQHFNMQHRQVEAYSMIVSLVNNAGHAIKKGDEAEARKQLASVPARIEELALTTGQLMSGFLVKVGNRNALATHFSILSIHRMKIISMLKSDKPLTVVDLNEKFCSFARGLQKFRTAIYSLEDMRKNISLGIEELPPELIIFGDSVAFSCEKIPAELFELKPRSEYQRNFIPVIFQNMLN